MINNIGLVPSGKKLLPEAILTQTCVAHKASNVLEGMERWRKKHETDFSYSTRLSY